MERPGGSSLQTILDLFGVRGRSFSDPNASTSNHDVACHPLAGWWKPSDGYANLTLLLLPKHHHTGCKKDYSDYQVHQREHCCFLSLQDLVYCPKLKSLPLQQVNDAIERLCFR